MATNQELEALRADFNKAIDALKEANEHRDSHAGVIRELVSCLVVPSLLDPFAMQISALKGGAIFRSRKICQSLNREPGVCSLEKTASRLSQLAGSSSPQEVAESVAIGFECALRHKTKYDLHWITKKHLHDASYEIGYNAVAAS